MATHDLKAPISNLEGYYSFLKEDIKKNKERLNDTVYWIGKSIEQAKKTISDLTIVTQLSTLKEKEDPIDLQQLLDEILESLHQDISLNEVELKIDFQKLVPIISILVELG